MPTNRSRTTCMRCNLKSVREYSFPRINRGMLPLGRLEKVTSQFRARISQSIGRSHVAVGAWREGGNFGDDYIAGAMRKYIADVAPRVCVTSCELYPPSTSVMAPDIFVVSGGGLWGPSNTGTLDESLFSAWMDTKATLVIANIGIESFDPSGADNLKLLVERAALFSVRDRNSYEVVVNHIGPSKTMLCADTTYLSPITFQRTPVDKVIGVNICGPEVENYTRQFSTLHVASSLNRLKRQGFRLRATPLAYGHAPDYPHCSLVDPDCLPVVDPTVYAECQTFVGMRFHSVLIALQNCIPTVAISYSGKVRRLMAEYNLDHMCFEPDDPELADRIEDNLSSLDLEAHSMHLRDINRQIGHRLEPFRASITELLNSN